MVYLRQSLPTAGIIEECESTQGERGRVGQGRVDPHYTLEPPIADTHVKFPN